MRIKFGDIIMKVICFLIYIKASITLTDNNLIENLTINENTPRKQMTDNKDIFEVETFLNKKSNGKVNEYKYEKILLDNNISDPCKNSKKYFQKRQIQPETSQYTDSNCTEC